MGDTTISLVTIPNVPIISTGVEYPLASGPTTFTEEDLAEIVASQDDPAISSPRLKLSKNGPHTEGINEPAFGKVINLRLSEDKQTIFGDYVGVPKWLADVMPVAYPSRSVEGNWNVKTATGHNWRLVITAVELLGVHWPGVSTLSDLPLYYGEELPEGVTVAALNQTGGDPMPQISAAVNVEDVRRAYYTKLEAAGPEYAWWWIRAIQVEPSQLIVDNDEGQLYRVAYAVEGDEVTFQDPIEVKIEYVDVPKQKAAAMVAAGLLAAGGSIAASYASRAESRPVNATQEGGEVDIDALRTALGLPDDASEEQVLAEVERLKGLDPNPSTQEATGNPGAPSVTQPTPTTPAESQGPPVEGAAVEDDGTVRLDKETYERLMRGAQTAENLEATAAQERRNTVIEAAVRDGKIPPARREFWAQLLEKDYDGTKATLDSLQAGLVPVSEHGSGGSAPDPQEEGLPESWFGAPGSNALAAARARGAQRSRVTQAMEG